MPLKDPAARAAYNAARYAQKKEQLIEWQKAYYRLNRDAILAYKQGLRVPGGQREYDLARHAKDPTKRRAKDAAYYAANPHKFKANNIRRKTRRILATPPWADEEAIRAIYLEAARLRAAGYEVEVDHDIPLRGRLVSGLHTESNLRIVPRLVNRSKGRSFAAG